MSFLFCIFLLGCKEDQELTLKIRNPVRIPPIGPSLLSFNTITTNPTYIPIILFNKATDLSGSGIKEYRINIGTSPCGSEFFTTLVQTANEMNLALIWANKSFAANIPYYVSVIAYDNLGQASEPVCSSDSITYITTGWKGTAFLKRSNAIAGDGDNYFGIAVDADGDTIVAGHPGDNSLETSIINGETSSFDQNGGFNGAAHVYRKVSGEWKQEAYLKAPYTNFGYNFGRSVAISGDTIVVGSPDEGSDLQGIINGSTATMNDNQVQSGAIYVFKRTGTTWAQEAFIKPSNNDAGNNFGFSVDIDGDTIVASAIKEDSNLTTITNGSTASTDKSAPESGAVYVFKRTGTNWAQEAYIKAGNSITGLQFGWSVKISGDLLAVSSVGDYSGSNSIINGTGVPLDFDGLYSGAVFLYRRTGTTWAQEAFIKPPNNKTNNQFGYAIDLEGDRLVASSISESSNFKGFIADPSNIPTDPPIPSSGAVYVFEKSIPLFGGWGSMGVYKAPNPGPNDQFGVSVAIKGDLLAIGAPYEDGYGWDAEWGSVYPFLYDNSLEDHGAVYMYGINLTTGTEQARIEGVVKSPVTTNFLGVGSGLAFLNSDGLVIGIPGDSSDDVAPVNGVNIAPNGGVSLPFTGALYILENFH